MVMTVDSGKWESRSWLVRYKWFYLVTCEICSGVWGCVAALAVWAAVAAAAGTSAPVALADVAIVLVAASALHVLVTSAAVKAGLYDCEPEEAA